MSDRVDTLVEKFAPVGYVVSDTVYTVVIGETSVVTAVEYLEENDNKPASFVIITLKEDLLLKVAYNLEQELK